MHSSDRPFGVGQVGMLDLRDVELDGVQLNFSKPGQIQSTLIGMVSMMIPGMSCCRLRCRDKLTRIERSRA